MLKLNDAGLPEPGRELDAWIAEHVLGWKWCRLRQPFWHDGPVRMLLPPDSRLWEHRDEADGSEPLCTLPGYACHCPEVSTTSAFFQVMEAMEKRGYYFDLSYHMNGLLVRVREIDEGTDPDHVRFEHVFCGRHSIEELTAWAVCACAWKAKGGEG